MLGIYTVFSFYNPLKFVVSFLCHLKYLRARMYSLMDMLSSSGMLLIFYGLVIAYNRSSRLP